MAHYLYVILLCLQRKYILCASSSLVKLIKVFNLRITYNVAFNLINVPKRFLR